MLITSPTKIIVGPNHLRRRFRIVLVVVGHRYLQKSSGAGPVGRTISCCNTGSHEQAASALGQKSFRFRLFRNDFDHGFYFSPALDGAAANREIGVVRIYAVPMSVFQKPFLDKIVIYIFY
jgi:hypothetical protein